MTFNKPKRIAGEEFSLFSTNFTKIWTLIIIYMYE